MKIINGNKPSWLTYLTAVSIIVMLIFTFTRLSDRVGTKSAGSAVLAQEVKDVEARIGTAENDIKIANKERGEHRTDIEVLKTQVTNVLTKVEAQTVAQNKTNDLLFEIVQRLPKDN